LGVLACRISHAVVARQYNVSKINCIYTIGSWRPNPRQMLLLEIVEEQLNVIQW